MHFIRNDDRVCDVCPICHRNECCGKCCCNRGEPCPVCPKGATGAMGATGPKGATGAMGETGPKGATGNAGPSGAQGLPGPQGKKGADGLAATIKIEPSSHVPFSEEPYVYNIGTATNAILRFGIPDGRPGEQGPVGLKGDNGATGATGPVGESFVADFGSYMCWRSQTLEPGDSVIFFGPKFQRTISIDETSTKVTLGPVRKIMRFSYGIDVESIDSGNPVMEFYVNDVSTHVKTIILVPGHYSMEFINSYLPDSVIEIKIIGGGITVNSNSEYGYLTCLAIDNY